MKIIVIGSRAYNELVGRIEKIEAAIASLPEKGRAWNKEYINDEWMDGEQVCRYLGISGRTLQRLRSDHVITNSSSIYADTDEEFTIEQALMAVMLKVFLLTPKVS